MYNVLIVDDELAIREGLATIINWNDYGYRVVDTAANAVEARHKYTLYTPDLMIVDIRMPGGSGLDLIEELRAEDPEIHIIILSGYADFSYAQRALSLGTDGYLLKPVDEDELQQYLLKLSGELSQKVAYRQKYAEVQEWNRERLVQSVLLGNSSLDKASVELEAMESDLWWNSYQVILIRLILPDHADNGSTAAVKENLAKSLEESGRGFVFSIDSYLGVLLKPSFQIELSRKMLHQEVSEVVSGQGLECILAAGDTIYDFSNLPESYHTALERIKDHFFYDESMIIGPDSVKLKVPSPHHLEDVESYLESVSERIFLAVDIGNFGLMETLIQEAGQMMANAEMTERTLKSNFSRIMAFSLTRLSIQYPALGLSNNILAEQMQLIYEQPSLPVLQRYVIQLLRTCGSDIVRDDMELLIKKMIDFIHRNYFQHLKLEVLADVFNYNSTYLGKLFKGVTGDSFNTYLDKVRMSRAKELLDKGLKIHQVAQEVGLGDVDYFREKFKKYEGISPSVYRKK